MKGRWILTGHLAALALAGLATWLVFTKGEPEAGGQVILDLKADQVERLEYLAASHEMVAEAIEGGQAFRLTVREKLSQPRKPEASKVPKAADSPDGASGPDGAVAGPEQIKTTRYRASPEFAKALARVLPLEAIREVGRVGDEKLVQFGLQEPEARLRVVSRGQTVEFQLGKRTYGRSSVYLRQGADGPVQLVSSGLVSTVDFRPPRYKELRFLGLATKELEQVFIDCGPNGRRSLVQQDRFQAKGGTWAPSDAPNAEDALYGNWMGKLLKLSLIQYLDDPVTTDAQAHCKLAFQLEGNRTVTAELGWVDDPAGKRVFHGRSEFSGDWVQLDPTATGSLVSDLGSVLGAETPKSP